MILVGTCLIITFIGSLGSFFISIWQKRREELDKQRLTSDIDVRKHLLIFTLYSRVYGLVRIASGCRF
jgi:hypothetical protein